MKRRLYLTCGQTFGTREEAIHYIRSQYTPASERWLNALGKIAEGKYLPVPCNAKLPHAFSLRDKMPPVYNQASRGTCTANAAVALMEYYTGRRYRFSVQYLYERMKRAERENYQKAAMEILAGESISDPEMAEEANALLAYLQNDGNVQSLTKEELASRLYHTHIQMDGGSNAKYVFSVLERWGICTYDIWPYAREQLDQLDEVSDCNNQTLPPGADEDAKRHRLNDKYYIFPSPNNVEEIKNYLAGASRYDPMPVYIGVPVFIGPDGKYFPEENGVVRLPHIQMIDLVTIDCEVETVNALKHEYRVLSQDPDSAEKLAEIPVLDSKHIGGHAMLLVGYVDDEAITGGGYFLVRNSWGDDWGEGGYGKIPYAYIELFATSAATILRPKDAELAVSDPLSTLPDDLKAYAQIAESDAKDRMGLWRIAKGDLILVDADGTADLYSDSNAAVFRRNGYSWKERDGGNPSIVSRGAATSTPDAASSLSSDGAHFLSGLEIAFQDAHIPFPLLGGVKKPGWLSSPVKTERFSQVADLTGKMGSPLRVYDISGGKVHFRIAALIVSAKDSPEESATRARGLVSEYNASQRFDPCTCTITIICCPGKLASPLPSYITESEVRVVLDSYTHETGWRAGVLPHPGDPYWHDWILRLVPNTPDQWKARFQAAYREVEVRGGHVTLTKMAVSANLPEDEIEKGLPVFLPGFRIQDGRIVRG